MKGLYDQAAHSLFLKERRYIKKIDFPSLIGEVWRSFKPEYAINGFRKTGIIPLNRNAIEDSSLLPSEPFTSQLSSPSQNPTQPTETQTPSQTQFTTQQLQVDTHLQNTPQLQASGTQAQQSYQPIQPTPLNDTL